MNTKACILAQVLAGGDEPETADLIYAQKLAGGGGGGVTIVPWSTGTDEEIVAMLQAAHAGTIDLQTDGGWAVGDTRMISVDAFITGDNVNVPQQDVSIVISQFGDYMNCGCVMQFDFKDELSTGATMNGSKSNAGGYGGSRMKQATLPALAAALPSWFQNILCEFSCLASAGSMSQTIETVSANKLALRSEVEIFGNVIEAKEGEGTQIDYFKTDASRVKTRGHAGTAAPWWTRSPRGADSQRFEYVTDSGAAGAFRANESYGIAPFGCL